MTHMLRSRQSLRTCTVTLCSLLVAFGVFGCEKKQENADDISRVKKTVLNTTMPTETAKSCIELLLLDAELGPKPSTQLEGEFYAKAMDIVAVSDLFARHRTNYSKKLVGNELIRAKTEVIGRVFRSWASTVAYYRDDIDLTQMAEIQQPGGKTIVCVPLKGEKPLYVWVWCVAQPGETPTWRVLNLEITPKGPPQTTIQIPLAPLTESTTETTTQPKQ